MFLFTVRTYYKKSSINNEQDTFSFYFYKQMFLVLAIAEQSSLLS